jgi:hypothetical protein
MIIEQIASLLSVACNDNHIVPLSYYMNSKSQKGFLPIWIILVAVALIAASTGVAVYQTKKATVPKAATSPQVIESANPLLPEEGNGEVGATVSPSPTPGTIGDYTGWKTYRNEKYGFEFRYPVGVSMRDFESIGHNRLEGKSLSFPEEGPFLFLEIFRNDQQDLSLRNWFETVLRGHEFTGGDIETEGRVDGVDSINNIFLNDVPALEVVGNVFENRMRRIFVFRGSFVIEFYSDYPMDIQDPPVVSQILSTFKFIAPTPTPDPTAGWKTYRNDKYGFEVKYPRDWFLNIRGESVHFSVSSVSPVEEGDIGEEIGINFYDNDRSLDINDWLKEYYADEIDFSKLNITTFTVLSGVKFALVRNAPSEFPYNIEAYAILDNRVIGIVLEPIRLFENVYFEILSTFKFIAPTPTPDPTANWKTYRNEKYGFEFRYPNDWLALPERALVEKGLPRPLTELYAPNRNEYPMIVISSIIVPGNFDAEKYIADNYAQIINLKKLYGLDLIAYRFDIKRLNEYTPIALIQRNDQIYEINYSFGYEEDVDQFGEIFDQILSTFKFL